MVGSADNSVAMEASTALAVPSTGTRMPGAIIGASGAKRLRALLGSTEASAGPSSSASMANSDFRAATPNETDGTGSPYTAMSSSRSETDLTLLTPPTSVDALVDHSETVACSYPFKPTVAGRPVLRRRHSYSGGLRASGVLFSSAIHRPSALSSPVIQRPCMPTPVCTESAGGSEGGSVPERSVAGDHVPGDGSPAGGAENAKVEPVVAITAAKPQTAEPEAAEDMTGPASGKFAVEAVAKDAAPAEGPPRTAPSLETLPPELLLLILEPLSQQALSALSRTCRSLHRRVTPMLYAADVRNHDCLSLLWGAHFSSVTTMQRALDMGAKVNHIFKRSTPHPRVSWRAVSAPTPLIAAIRMNQAEAVRFLCKAGANPNIPSWIRWDRWFGFGVVRGGLGTAGGVNRAGSQGYAARTLRTVGPPEPGTEEHATMMAAQRQEHSPFAIPVHVGATLQPSTEAGLIQRQRQLVARANDARALGADAPPQTTYMADLLNNPRLELPPPPALTDGADQPAANPPNANAPWGVPGPPTSSHPRGAEEVYPWYPLNHALDAFSDDEPPWEYSRRHFEVDIVRALVEAGAEVDIGPSDISHLPLNFWVGRGAGGDHTMEWIPPLWQSLWGYVPAEVTELLLQHGANPAAMMCPGQGAVVRDKIDMPLSPLEALIRCRMDRGQYPTDLHKIEILLKHMDFEGVHRPLRPTVDFLTDAWWNPKAVQIMWLFVKHGAVQLRRKEEKARKEKADVAAAPSRRWSRLSLFRRFQAPEPIEEEPAPPAVYELSDAQAPILIYRALLRCYQRLMAGANIPCGEGTSVFKISQIFPAPDYVELVRVLLFGRPAERAVDKAVPDRAASSKKTHLETKPAAEPRPEMYCGEDPNTQVRSPGFDGAQTPLRMAACFAETRLPGAGLARVLLHAGADPLAADSQGATALHYASQFGRVSTLTQILKYIPRAIPVFVKRPAGRTPPNRTPATTGTPSDPEAPTPAIDTADHDGWTALHYAAQFFYHTTPSPGGVAAQGEIAKLLLEHGASITARTRRESLTPLHVAVRAGNYAVAELIVARAKETNMIAEVLAATDTYGRTPMHILTLAELDLPGTGRYEGLVLLCPYSPNTSVYSELVAETLHAVGDICLRSLRNILDKAAREHTMLVRTRDSAKAAAPARAREYSVAHRVGAAARDAAGRVGGVLRRRESRSGRETVAAVPDNNGKGKEIAVAMMENSGKSMEFPVAMPESNGTELDKKGKGKEAEAEPPATNAVTVAGDVAAAPLVMTSADARDTTAITADDRIGTSAAVPDNEQSTEGTSEESRGLTRVSVSSNATDTSVMVTVRNPTSGTALQIPTARTVRWNGSCSAGEPSTAAASEHAPGTHGNTKTAGTVQAYSCDPAVDKAAQPTPRDDNATVVSVVWSHFFGPLQLELWNARQPERPGKFFPNVWDEEDVAARRPVCRLVAQCRADTMQEWWYAA